MILKYWRLENFKMLYCGVCTVLWTLSTFHWTLFFLYRQIYSAECTLSNVQCAIYTVPLYHGELCPVQIGQCQKYRQGIIENCSSFLYREEKGWNTQEYAMRHYRFENKKKIWLTLKTFACIGEFFLIWSRALTGVHNGRIGSYARTKQ